MEFDITHLDKKLVIQTLFAHAAPLSLGKLEYNFRKLNGDNVEGLTDDECEHILYEFEKLDAGNLRLLDYHKGKPMKLNFQKKNNGRILVNTDSYDVRNGKYRFFESLLNLFSIDEIFITKKGYRQFVMTDLQEHLIRSKEEENIFKTLIKNTVQKENNLGKYWTINESKAKYKSAYMY